MLSLDEPWDVRYADARVRRALDLELQARAILHKLRHEKANRVERCIQT
jgi:hypothetical protein